MEAVAHARYVRIALASKITGLTVEAIEKKIHSGTWVEGRQYRRKGREIYVDMKGYDEWVEQDVAGSN